MSDDKVVDLRPRKKVKPLTGKQEAFVRAILSDENLSQAEAYRRAYDAGNMSDHVVWNEASKLFMHRVVSMRIKDGRAKQEANALHSGASLRGVLEKELMKIITAADDKGNPAEPQVIRLKAMDMIGRSAKSQYFLDRSEVTTVENLTEKEVTEQLEAKLAKAFGAKTG